MVLDQLGLPAVDRVAVIGITDASVLDLASLVLNAYDSHRLTEIINVREGTPQIV